MPEKEIDHRRDMPDIQIKGSELEFQVQLGGVVQGAAIVSSCWPTGFLGLAFPKKLFWERS